MVASALGDENIVQNITWKHVFVVPLGIKPINLCIYMIMSFPIQLVLSMSHSHNLDFCIIFCVKLHMCSPSTDEISSFTTM